MKKIAAQLLFAALLSASCTVTFNTSGDSADPYVDGNAKSADWTIMYYVDADNNLEQALLDDILELSNGLASTEMINVIALVDRIPGHSHDSSILGSVFNDTRLYRIGSGEIYPLEGGTQFPNIGAGKSTECNMGDAATLASFIDYCKENYPADNYGLIFTNHGGGVRSTVIEEPVILPSSDRGAVAAEFTAFSESAKSVCYDDTSGGDSLYTAEITDVLDSSHSVHLFVIDACLMGMLEVGYQYSPDVSSGFSADYLVASPPTVWWDGYPYDIVFQQVSTGAVTPVQLGTYFVERQKLDTAGDEDGTGRTKQVLALYDLRYADEVLDALDALAAELDDDDVPTPVYDTDGVTIISYTAVDETLDGLRFDASLISYFDETEEDEWYACPHFDLYDFAQLEDASAAPYILWTNLQSAVDHMVLESFGNSGYSGFDEGSNGLGFFFPDGERKDDEVFIDGVAINFTNNPHWSYQWWYTGIDTESIYGADYLYGKLEACHSNTNGIVEGWYELLEETYDPSHAYTSPSW